MVHKVSELCVLTLSINLKLCAVIIIKMVTIKTKHGEFKYKDWQWDLAWLLVFICGVAVGIIVGL